MDRLKRSKFAIISLLSGILAPGVLMLGSIAVSAAMIELGASVFALTFIASIILAIMAVIFGGVVLTQEKRAGKVAAIVGALLGIMHFMWLSVAVFL